MPGRDLKAPAPVKKNKKVEYIIEKIVDSKISYGRNKYLVRWLGYGPESDEWLDEGYMENAQKHIQAYELLNEPRKQNRRKAGPILDGHSRQHNAQL